MWREALRVAHLGVTDGLSPDGTLIDVPFNFVVALRDVSGKQSYPREAQQIDRFELPVSDDHLRDWVRQGQEAAAAIPSRENLLESIHQPDSRFDWEVTLCSLTDGSDVCRFSSGRG